MQCSDWIWLAWVLAAALAFSVWGLPYFTQLGYPLWSLIVYAFFVVLFIYGRNHGNRCDTRVDKKLEKPK